MNAVERGFGTTYVNLLTGMQQALKNGPIQHPQVRTYTRVDDVYHFIDVD